MVSCDWGTTSAECWYGLARIVAYVFIAFILSFFGIFCIQYRKSIFAWFTTLVPYCSTKNPRPPPKWLRDSIPRVTILEVTDRKTIYGKPTNFEYINEELHIEKSCDVYQKLEKITKYGCPEDTCVFKLAKESFTCDDSDFTAFKAKGFEQTGYFSYQQYGKTIQATFYHADGVKWLAGFCIYIENPYRYKASYPAGPLKKLMSMPTYYPDEPDETLLVVPSVNPQDPEILLRNHFGAIQSLKLNQCCSLGDTIFESVTESDDNKFNRCSPFIKTYADIRYIRSLRVALCAGKPVTVGWNLDGKMVHVEWEFGEPKVVDCPICAGEQPPEYSSL